ncbi:MULTISPECIES: hypothetical protein [Tsukamurella]|uniref:Uncharacterized protein n=1 Tax=Tsukamurella columbiensis TaxID=128509 RepID=A0ABX1LEX2_9ACTN|nr:MULTISPECIES: hypothetical protein [Tsukamurella]NMD55568.1 hypothetical protein [Tsukamurella columbiensis]
MNIYPMPRVMHSCEQRTLAIDTTRKAVVHIDDVPRLIDLLQAALDAQRRHDQRGDQ